MATRFPNPPHAGILHGTAILDRQDRRYSRRPVDADATICSRQPKLPGKLATGPSLVVPMLKDGERLAAISSIVQEVAPVHRQANRVVQEFRRPGSHRHREHAAAQRAARICCNSRPPLLMCSRSSAARLSIFRSCSTRWSICGAALRGRRWHCISSRRRDLSASRLSAIPAEFMANFKNDPLAPGRGRAYGRTTLKARRFIFPTFLLTRNTHGRLQRKGWPIPN